MDDQAFAKALAERALGEQPHLARAGIGGGALDFLRQVFAALRASGISWPKIIALVSQVVTIIVTGQGDWAAILAAIWTLFFPVNPPPTPPIQFPT